MLKTLFALLFTAAVFGAGVFVGNDRASRPFSNAREILASSRTQNNVRAAETVSRLYQEMKPLSDKVKPAFAAMSLCRRTKTVHDLRTASIELALQQITHSLQQEIDTGGLPTRESGIFAFSGVFTAWLFSVNEPDLIKAAEHDVKSRGNTLTKAVCDREEEKARLLIEQLRFVSPD